ncbi:hypothetical protein ACC711_39295, partial [Rhizobium ruizarguesonis]
RLSRNISTRQNANSHPQALPEISDVIFAMMYASEEGTAKLGRDHDITIMKSWLPVQDERTRVNHAAMSYHVAIAMDADFIVGGALMKR